MFFGATLRSKTNILSVSKQYFLSLRKFLTSEVETPSCERKTKSFKKFEFNHEKKKQEAYILLVYE